MRTMSSKMETKSSKMETKSSKMETKSSKVVYEGWMVRCGRRRIGRAFIHMRYFVLEPRLLAYYKKKPQTNQVPIKALVIDGNCRVEDRGMKAQHGNMVYVLCVYNKKDKSRQIMMAAFNIQEALMWKEKIELVIDQHQGSSIPDGNGYSSYDNNLAVDSMKIGFHSDQESPPESVLDWTGRFDEDLLNMNNSNQVVSRKHWRLLQCQNGLRIFEELLEADYLPRSCSRAMGAIGVVEASCEEIFELVMNMDSTRFEWDCSFQYGSLVEEVDGHTAVLYHRLQLYWYPTEHEHCGPQPGFVRAHIESGGFNISPLKPRHGRPRSKVQHLMQIDLKGWGVGYLSSFKQHCLLQMLNGVAGLREWFSQSDEIHTAPRIPVMINMTSASVSSQKNQENQEPAGKDFPSLDELHSASRNSMMLDEFSDEDEEFQVAEAEQEAYNEVEQTALEEDPTDQIDLSCFSGNLQRNDNDDGRDCWRISDGNNFRVRSKHFFSDKSKIPAGKHTMELVAVDWFKDIKRIDHVARRPGCAVQVPGSTHYSMVFYLVTKQLVPGSLLQCFVDGDDEFRNSRLKLIPSVPKQTNIFFQKDSLCLFGK
ncbi:hypothetical protein PVL29_019555 [Vitis rotundifolia]|uniref:PH domain-containing protein n=1 Tax=Vitis rotundifolia TaxID=103349 RepID=A0AA39DDP6_VITRO|nr:hypothetical protein PVL29_019555 [Vitis rotundifolia]